MSNILKSDTGKFCDLSVILLHDQMHNKIGQIVTTSLTMIDVHDFARSSCTYGVTTTFISHPSPALQRLAGTLKSHWQEGYGATYNPNRSEALGKIEVVSNLDQAIEMIKSRTGQLPKIIATSAKDGGDRITYEDFRNQYLWCTESTPIPYLLMFGTGWGMSEALLKRADYFLSPINGYLDYNHLSVRSACAISLDRLLGKR